jgi:hypothetical protein
MFNGYKIFLTKFKKYVYCKIQNVEKNEMKIHKITFLLPLIGVIAASSNANAQITDQNLQTKIDEVQVSLKAKPNTKVPQIPYIRQPAFFISQRSNLMFIDQGASNEAGSLQKIPIKSGWPNKAISKGVYDIVYKNKGVTHFSGWGNPNLFARYIWSLSKRDQNGQSKPISWFIRNGSLIPTGHTQPQSCPGLQSYLSKQKQWVQSVSTQVRVHDPLKKSDPTKYNSLVSEILKKNPEPKDPCPPDPTYSWGVSNGCLRLNGFQAPTIFGIIEHHESFGRKPLVYVDTLPANLPNEFVNVLKPHF